MRPIAPMLQRRPTALPACAPRVRSVHWETWFARPRRSRRHRRSPARPLSPGTTTRTLAAGRISSLGRRRTLGPIASTAVLARRLVDHAFRLRNERLHRQTQAPAFVAIDELDLHALTLLD